MRCDRLVEVCFGEKVGGSIGSGDGEGRKASLARGALSRV